MDGLLQEIQSFFRELKRRNVYRVAATYGVVGFVIIQVADITFPHLGLPSWAVTLVIALVVLGFPVALVLAWAFELSPRGVKRTGHSVQGGDQTEGEQADKLSKSSGALKALIVLGGVALAVVGGWYLTGSGPNPDAPERSIAVLPFETIGAEEQSAFTDGVHGDLLTRLSRISDVRATSRTSVLRYRQPQASLPTIARELGVTWILRGEVQQSGDSVRVNARLVNARKDQQVWAEGYTRQLTADNLFAIQEEITRQISQELEAHLTPAEQKQVGSRPTESLEAYRLYVRGRSFLDQQTESGMRQAAGWFRRAIDRDSTYALAWSGLADALLYLSEYGYAPADSILPIAREAAGQALNLEPTSAEAHVSRAFLQAAEGDGATLIRELRRAIELRPSYAQARSLLGWYYPLLGRPHLGLESARRGVELDPFAPEAWANLALGYLTTGEPDSALAPARRTQELQSDFSAGRFYEAIALHQLGRHREASSILGEIQVGWAPAAPRTTAALARLYEGDSLGARDLRTALPEAVDGHFYRGLIDAALGNGDAAFDAFARIEGWERHPLLGWPNISLRYLYTRSLGPLRDDPRYRNLITEINRAWGLNPDGSLPEGVAVSLGG